ncbi:MAG: hypothetical protein GXY34_13305 [Syntrophomonadaceae bacterium]|nr:hypothetical protein [Syntrophomonadaceae bacterium]
MGNKETLKIPVIRERFEEALMLRKTSIRKLGDISEIERTEKTIRRYLSKGEMPPDLLDRIGKYLNVDPEYLSGGYGRGLDKIEDKYTRTVLRSQLKAERFPYPYLKSEQMKLGYEEYFEHILIMHDISMNQFLNLPSGQRQELQLEIERAIASVISKHFKCDARGREGLPDLQYLEVMIGNDDPIDNENGITWRAGGEADRRD